MGFTAALGPVFGRGDRDVLRYGNDAEPFEQFKTI